MKNFCRNFQEKTHNSISSFDDEPPEYQEISLRNKIALLFSPNSGSSTPVQDPLMEKINSRVTSASSRVSSGSHRVATPRNKISPVSDRSSARTNKLFTNSRETTLHFNLAPKSAGSSKILIDE